MSAAEEHSKSTDKSNDARIRELVAKIFDTAEFKKEIDSIVDPVQSGKPPKGLLN